ncbi:MAG: phenylalanine--tRNA ligase subunit alpha, partial [Clostridia bacterium]|nr:phenylalanine--tRNA ligase subunit alpha [Clostridia bacterium]
MKDILQKIRNEAIESLSSAGVDLESIRIKYLGKKGELTAVLRGMGQLSPEERPKIGQIANEVRAEIEEMLKKKKEEQEEAAFGVSPDFDYTLPGYDVKSGGLHPITQMCYDLNDAFRSMGFEVFGGPEITSEYYAFDNLNFPPNHPARESMDTYWLEGHDTGSASDKLCLRPHLTGDSVRYMQTHKPPYRFVYPGRVYRNETTDNHHERAFFQYEALIVDK